MLGAERSATQTLGRSRSSAGTAVLRHPRYCYLPGACYSYYCHTAAVAAASVQRHASSASLCQPRRSSAACRTVSNSRAAAAGMTAGSSATTAVAAAGLGNGASISTVPTAGQLPAGVPEHSQLTYLQELRVADFALVPSARVSFAPGLNSISGQSGAGKSVLIDALAQLLGAAAHSDSVRPPADTAVVEGTWWCGPEVAAAAADLLVALGLPAKALPGVWSIDTAGRGGFIHIRREISCMPAAGSPSVGSAAAGGPGPVSSTRSRVLINGSPSSLRVLRALGSLLVDVNGQHAALALRDSNQQLQLLDRIAGTTTLAAQLSTQVARLSELESLLAQTAALADAADRAALQRKVDLIDRANISAGEEVQLRLRLQAMESRRGCLEAAAAVQAGIAGDGSTSGSSSLNDALRLLMSQLRGVLSSEEQQLRLLKQQQGKAEAVSSSNGNSKTQAPSSSSRSSGDVIESHIDSTPVAEEAAERAAAVAALRAAYDACEAVGEELIEAQAQLQEYASIAGYSSAEYASISSRLELIEKLIRSFKVRSSRELLDLAQQYSDELEQYYDSLGQLGAWQAEAATLQAGVTATALQLSAARSAAASRLVAAVEGCLAQLAMSSSRFAVDIAWTPVGKSEQEAGPSSKVVLAPVEAEPQTVMQREGHHSSSSSSSSDASGDMALYQLTPSGLDRVTFLLSAGPTEPMRPLAATASGGEAARIMLALKAAPAAAAAAQSVAALTAAQAPPPAADAGSSDASVDTSSTDNSSSSSSSSSCGGLVSLGPPVLVMDELDAGLGSRLGAAVGQLLTRLVGAGCQQQPPAACQVLVVTHTPQVAAHASHHIQVLKAAAEDGRVITTFKHLATAQERQAELADMLGLGQNEGSQIAAEMMAAASAQKGSSTLLGGRSGVSPRGSSLLQLDSSSHGTCSRWDSSNSVPLQEPSSRSSAGAGASSSHSSSNSSCHSGNYAADAAGAAGLEAVAGSSTWLEGLSAAAITAGVAAEQGDSSKAT